MNKIDKIMNIMNNINYGFLDKNGFNIFDADKVASTFNKEYYLMSPEEVLDKKIGVCWDQVELERKLFDDLGIENETYFIYIDDGKYLPSHTFLVYYDNNKAYWFEQAWYDEEGIHEYNNLNSLLNDVEIKFRKSKENEVNNNLEVNIYKYNKPEYHISCDDFYKYIFTQSKVFTYKLKNATINDIERIKKYKLQTIFEHAKNLSNEEINDIKIYVNESIASTINDYQKIIYNQKIIGSFLVRNIDNGFLLDEIYIEKEYRNRKIGSSIIKDFIAKCDKNIYLWVYKANTQAIKLYQRLGFDIKEETNTRYYMEHIK